MNCDMDDVPVNELKRTSEAASNSQETDSHLIQTGTDSVVTLGPSPSKRSKTAAGNDENPDTSSKQELEDDRSGDAFEDEEFIVLSEVGSSSDEESEVADEKTQATSNIQETDKDWSLHVNPGCHIEFRAVFAHDIVLTEKQVFAVLVEKFDHPVEMAYHTRKSFYYVRIPLSVGTIELKYKFCLIEPTSVISHFEGIPGEQQRSINLLVEPGSDIVLLNVCNFESLSSDWASLCGFGLRKLLPTSGSSIFESQRCNEDTCILRDVLLCIETLSTGWKTGFAQHIIPNEVIESVLVDWLASWKVSSCSGEFGADCIVMTLRLAAALLLTNYRVQQKELLSSIFDSLSLGKLDKVQETKLYEELCGEYESVWKRFGLPPIPALIASLIAAHGHLLTAEFLLALPLYWLMDRDAFSPESNKSDAVLNTCLPQIYNLDWNVVKLKFSTASHQNGLLNLTREILLLSRQHSWIVGIFLYFMKEETLALVARDKKLWEYFKCLPLDLLFQSFLKGHQKGCFSKADTRVWKDFFQTRVITETLESEKKENVEHEEVHENILQCISSFFQLQKEKYLEFLNKDIIWFIKFAQDIAVLLEKGAVKVGSKRKYTDALNCILAFLKDRISKTTVINFEETEFWGELLSINWTDKNFLRCWKDSLLTGIKHCVHQMHATPGSSCLGFVQFYMEQLTGFTIQADLEDCFLGLCIKFVEERLSDPYSAQELYEWLRKLSDAMVCRPGSRCVMVFCAIFVKQINEAKLREHSKTIDVLYFLFNWTFSSEFYSLFYRGHILGHFSPCARQSMKRIAKQFEDVALMLHAYEIEVGFLELIAQNQAKFMQLCKCFQRLGHLPECSEDETTERHLMYSFKLLDIFKRTKSLVLDFLFICGRLYDKGATFRTDQLSKLVGEDIFCRKVCDLVSQDEFPLTSTAFFQINKCELREFALLSLLKKSRVFYDVFMNEMIRGHTTCPSWQDMLGIWEDVKERLVELCRELQQGEIYCDKVVDQFRCMYGNERAVFEEFEYLHAFAEACRQECTNPLGIVAVEDTKATCNNSRVVIMLNPDEQMSRLRAEQVYHILLLERRGKVADVLWKVKDVLDLKGGFRDVYEKLALRDEIKIMKLRELGKLAEISDELCNVQPEHIDGLLKFVEQKDMISWLKKRVKDMTEVQAMCDLALISAGENPMDTGRVSCFLSAVTGFAPLLFDLKEDAGMQELLANCQKVWAKIDSDTNLLKKWHDTSLCLSLLEEMECHHGSVEKQSLIHVQEINDHGVYKIKHTESETVPTVEGSVILTLPSKSSSRDALKIMKLNQLEDLQSRLMLIAGDAQCGQYQVNWFMELLAAVKRMVEVYVQLILSGSLLFNDWFAVIKCIKQPAASESPKIHIQLQFTGKSPLLGATGTCSDLDQLTLLFKDTLQRWKNHVSIQRMKHYFLNEFNSRQIIYLCHELDSFHSDVIPDQVHSLLSLIILDPRTRDIRNALKESEKVQASSECSVETKDSSTTVKKRKGQVDLLQKQYEMKGSNEGNSSLEEKKAVVSMLVRMDRMDETLARAAVQACYSEGSKDLADVRNWADRHESSTSEVVQYSEEFEEEMGFTCTEREVSIITSVLESGTEKNLTSVLKDLERNLLIDSSFRCFLRAVKTAIVGCENMVVKQEKYLTIQQLGEFLTALGKLRKKYSSLKPPQRTLALSLRKARPNVLIFPEEEILSAVLSVYMYGEAKPLPSVSEVLVCDAGTSVNEVERFFIRAMCTCNTKGRPIFTLAFADKLTFSVSTAAEKMYLRLLNAKNMDKKYQLVIILSNHRHYLAACFEKYIASGVVLKSRDDISKYLENALKAKKPEESAANVDMGKSIVRVVKSSRSGNGKSLYIKRLGEKSQAFGGCYVITIRFLSREVRIGHFIQKIYQTDEKLQNKDKVLIHLDFTPAVQDGVEQLIFKLIVLGCIQDCQGRVWLRHSRHFYALEVTDNIATRSKHFSDKHILTLLPKVECCSPRHALLYYNLGALGHSVTTRSKPTGLAMDDVEFRSVVFQRPYQYLKCLKNQYGCTMDSFYFLPYRSPGTPQDCLEVLLKHCCLENPSWAQLHYFARFLNMQFENIENSVFCKQPFALPGLKAFAVKFMIKMSQDFTTPSLDISDQSTSEVDTVDDDMAEMESEDEDMAEIDDRSDSDQSSSWRELMELEYDTVSAAIEIVTGSSSFGNGKTTVFEAHQFRRRWEESEHPYIFFNDDGHTMTFLNFNINDEGHLLNKEGQIVHQNIISKTLLDDLKRQKVDLNADLDSYTRTQKLEILCRVMGIVDVFDPDPSFELTRDNVLKILAIYMRLRCQMPVIIMGETGCGKTRMVEFIDNLKAGRSAMPDCDPLEKGEVPDTQKNAHQNSDLVTIKVHGGTTADDVYKAVLDSVSKSKFKNVEQGSIEASTSNVQTFPPYQRYLINKQRKVEVLKHRKRYKQSTILFFDEANTTEAIFAIKEVMCDGTIDGIPISENCVNIVAACNPYRKLSESAVTRLENCGLGYHVEKSRSSKIFGDVPLRSLVYRVVPLPPSMQPFVWDFGQLSSDVEKIYIQQMTKKLAENLHLSDQTTDLINSVLSATQAFMRGRSDECRYVSLRDVERFILAFEWFLEHSIVLYPLIRKELEKKSKKRMLELPVLDSPTRTLLQTVGFCYHSSLSERQPFREMLAQVLELPLVDANYIKEEFNACQKAFVRSISIDGKIALNQALRENVFMMVVCSDMRIPLFLIGKPGSSKSLAKTIIMDNMQGASSRCPLFRHFKQVHMISYQCSNLTDAAGIVGVFKQCSQLQKNQDTDCYAAVVVLDEIGLAEDSENLPLKVLHSLLECGNITGKKLEPASDQKVGFVGISNWCLDPAKMNRGIFVTRGSPDSSDLEKTAKGIFQNDHGLWFTNLSLLQKTTNAFIDVCLHQEQEYFGLRDYYGMMKMLHDISTSSGSQLTHEDVASAIQRNFGGAKTNVYEEFQTHFGNNLPPDDKCVQEMIKQNLHQTGNRFILLISKQLSIVHFLHPHIEKLSSAVQVIFGSGFPGDHSYIDVCKNIHKIKTFMETGQTVLLLNMSDIHESLYDALNQHYMTFGGQKYVDLGLGKHRVKCQISDDFRLIVIEKPDVVYEKYPIPLINRLEKHHFAAEYLLSPGELGNLKQLSTWTENFVRTHSPVFDHQSVFLGYNADTLSSVVLLTPEGLKAQKEKLVMSCIMDSIYRLSDSKLGEEGKFVQDLYFAEQCHDDLPSFLAKQAQQELEMQLFQIVSFSSVLSQQDKLILEERLNFPKNSIMLLNIDHFQTEQEFLNSINKFFKRCTKSGISDKQAMLLLQCNQAQLHGQLNECAMFCLQNRVKQFKDETSDIPCAKVIIAFVLVTERQCGRLQKNALVLQHMPGSTIVYIDELMPANAQVAPAGQFLGKSLADIWRISKHDFENGSMGSLFNIKSLLQGCVHVAVKKVESKQKGRYLQLVKILDNMFQCKDAITTHFTKILLTKMVELYDGADRQPDRVRNWLLAEACNKQKLQEGGSFKNTLFLCLKRHTSHAIAYVLSCIDKGNNFDILYEHKEEAWKVELWLSTFLKMPLVWKDAVHKEIFTISDQWSLNVSCRLPFSSQITEFMALQWKLTLSQHGAKADILSSPFFILCRESYMFKVLADAPDTAKVAKMKAYISDVVYLHLYVSCTDTVLETVVVEQLLHDASMKNYLKLRDNGSMCKGDEISVIFFTYKMISMHLNILGQIFKACPEILTKMDDLVRQQKEQDAFMIHIMAFKEVLKILTEKANQINDPIICKEWMNVTNGVKQLMELLLSTVTDQVVRKEILSQWSPLFLIDLFMCELLPVSSSESFERYLKVLSDPAKMIWKWQKKASSNSFSSLLNICSVLRRCFEETKLNVLARWGSVCCGWCKRKLDRPTRFPCDHCCCRECVQSILTSGRRCPDCGKHLPHTWEPSSSWLSASEEMEVSNFKMNCTSFLTQYLQQFYFKRDPLGIAEGPDNQIPNMRRMLEALVVQSGNTLETDTRGLDLNINSKGYILSILHTHNQNLALSDLGTLIHACNGVQLEELLVVVLSWLELSLIEDLSRDDKSSQWLDVFVQGWHQLTCEQPTNAIDMVKSVIRVRCALKEFASCIASTLQDEGEIDAITQDFINEVLRVVRDEDQLELLKTYVTKVGCHQSGTDWFYKLAAHDQYKVLVPSLLQKSCSDDAVVDHWSLLGWNYIQVKSRFFKIAPESVHSTMKEFFDCGVEPAFTNVLAALSWAHCWPGKKKDVVTILEKALGPRNRFFTFLNTLDTFVMPAIKAACDILNQKCHAIYQLLVVLIVALINQNDLMEGFCLMITEPRRIKDLLVPAMPQNIFFMLPEELRCQDLNSIGYAANRSAIYTCPNGHFYAIGDCTRPYVTAKCPECGKAIGGLSHKEAEGNKRVQMTEKSQAGYTLNSSEQNMDDPADRMTKHGAAVVHFFLHSCMLFGFHSDEEAIKSLLGCPDTSLAQQFLIQKMLQNLHTLSSALARNMDDTFLIMHRILHGVIKKREGNAGLRWTTLKNRREWEQKFREEHLVPIFQNIDGVVAEAQKVLVESAEIDESTMALYRFVHEAPVSTRPDTGILTWKNQYLWKMIHHQSFKHLSQVLEDSWKDSKQGEVLRKILQAKDLELLQYLKAILDFQDAMVQKCQHAVDLRDAEKISLKSYLAVDWHLGEVMLKKYIHAWNMISTRLHKSVPLLKQHIAPISTDSPIAVALPSSRGQGKYAKSLREYLVDLQNNFLSSCKQACKGFESVKEKEACQLLDSDIVCIEVEKDISRLMRIHTKYDIKTDEQGRHHHVTYNVEAMEKRVREKYVMYKSLIAKKTLPVIRYPQDIGLGADWTTVLENVPQKPLTAGIRQELDKTVDWSLADICDSVRMLAQAIGFLAKVDRRADKALLSFLKEGMLLLDIRLQLPETACLEHILQIYLQLSWRKSVKLALLGINPYENALCQFDMETLDESDIGRLHGAFKRTNVVVLQQRINEMMINLPTIQDGDWRLKHIFPAIGFMEDTEDESWFTHLPDKICFKNISHVFSLAVQFTAETQ